MLISTRGGEAVTASRAILSGIALDGGLYTPEALPRFSLMEIDGLRLFPYPERAARVLSPLLEDFSPNEIEEATTRAYGDRFEKGFPAPVRTLNGNTHLLELDHGPTLAFKDIALQILPYLLAMSARKNGVEEEICILVATSGDTGKAALEGFCDVPGTRCAVFYPKGGVSRAQYLQMATQPGENTHVIAVEGNFDDAQTGVKRIFSDSAFRAEMAARNRVLTSANSINYGRLAPQVAYYFSAYADLLLRGAVRLGDPVHFVVPTGNFGNILAGIFAREMGLPVAKFLCASNANRVLADFIQSGIYDMNRPFYKTSSPSMDILISSNLERYLFELSGRNAWQVLNWMDNLQKSGRYSVGVELLSQLHRGMIGGWVAENESLETIRTTLSQSNVLIDPHTAVAMAMLNRYRKQTGDRTPAIVVSTASPFKFGRAVAKALDVVESDEFACCRALTRFTGKPVPAQITSLETMPILHHEVCAPADMAKTLLNVFR